MNLVISCRTAISQNNSQCLFLDVLTDVARDIFQFLRRNKKEKTNTQESKERKFEEKVKGVSSFNIYIVAFAFLL